MDGLSNWGMSANGQAMMDYAAQQQNLANIQAQQAAAQNTPRLAVGISSGGGVTPVIPGVAGGSSSASNISRALNSSLPTVPTLNVPTMPTAPNFNAAMQQPANDPRIDALVAQLQAQANESNSALADRAAQQIASQRAVLDRQAQNDVTRSLASNGLLTTGGIAARMRDQISKPYEERLTAATADINANLQQQRGQTANNLLNQLTSLQNSRQSAAADAQRLQMQQAQQQYDMQMSAWNAQMRANETAYQRAMDQQQLTLQQQAASRQQTQYQQAMSGGGYSGGSMTGSVNGWNGGVNSFLESGTQPRDLYNNMLTADRANQQYQYNTAMNQRNAAQPQSTWTSVNPGNGISSAGQSASAAGGLFVSAANAQFQQPTGGYNYSYGPYSGATGAAMGAGSIARNSSYF